MIAEHVDDESAACFAGGSGRAGAVIEWALERAVSRRVGTRPASAQEGLAAGPVADDEHRVLVAGVAGGVEQPGQPFVGHFQTHQRSFSSSGVVSASIVAASPSRLARRRRDASTARSPSVSLEYG